MQLLSILSVLMILWCVAVDAQQPDCRILKEHCEACVRRLNSPINNVEFMNDGCREKLRRTWHWRNQTRCELQVISCSAHRRKLDCAVIAELAGMRRRT